LEKAESVSDIYARPVVFGVVKVGLVANGH